MKLRNIKWNFECGVSRIKMVKFYISLFLLYFSKFLYIAIRHGLLSDPRERDIFYITYMATQLFCQFAK